MQLAYPAPGLREVVHGCGGGGGERKQRRRMDGRFRVRGLQGGGAGWEWQTAVMALVVVLSSRALV